MKRDLILKYADTSGKGIEVAPYFNPVLTKREGHDLLIMDVFDTDTLRDRVRDDPLIDSARAAEIEEVDLVGDASRLGEVIAKAGLQGRIDYIVSSHNFEHLPNPILFLRGAGEALAPGGVLSMAVPDCRASFDHFRMPTRLSDWLAAYHEDRRQPSPETVLDSAANQSSYLRDGQPTPGCNLAYDDPAGFEPDRNLAQAYADYVAARQTPGEYRDTHCNVFFPESLELMLRDLRHLGLIELEVIEVSPTRGLEFFVHLRKPETPQTVTDEAFYAQRKALLIAMSRGIGAAGFGLGPVAGLRRAITGRLNNWRIRLKHRRRARKTP
jgi:SAM-dependent methyltransferase